MLALAYLVAFTVLKLGTCEDDLTMGLNFLSRYGYISSTRSRSGNHDVPTAIRNFQEFYGLPVSGVLDQATISLMKKPRCGVSDSSGGSRFKRYAVGPKWKKRHLTYFVQPGLDLPYGKQREIFAKALQFWADVSGLSFSAVNSANEADIKISFGRHSHGGTNVEGMCPYPFNGPAGVLAHAYFPEDGRAHFDEDETYTDGTPHGTNLLWVATHEFGHSLGLQHTNVQGAIMFPYYTGYVEGMALHHDDIAGIQYLYGSNSGGGVQTPAPTGSGSCTDRWHDCKALKADNQCEEYKENMKYWCARTCFLCESDP